MTLFYLVNQINSHANRFNALFSSIQSDYQLVEVIDAESSPCAVVNGKDLNGWNQIRDELSNGNNLVVSGPLDLLSLPLSGGRYQQVAISYAVDVMISIAKSTNLVEKFQESLSSYSAVIVDNYATENALIALGCNKESIIRIPWGPSGLDPNKVDRSHFCLPDDRPLVLYPRRIDRHYDPDSFIQALSLLVKEVPNFLAVLIENGSMVSAVKESVVRLELRDNVVWVPALDENQFQSLLSIVDAVVVSPITDGTSVTVMEAMSLGVPVVTSMTSGSAEWIMNGISGWSFPVGNIKELVNSLVDVLTVDIYRKKIICANAKRLVEMKAGWHSSAKILKLSLENILKERRHPL